MPPAAFLKREVTRSMLMALSARLLKLYPAVIVTLRTKRAAADREGCAFPNEEYIAWLNRLSARDRHQHITFDLLEDFATNLRNDYRPTDVHSVDLGR